MSMRILQGDCREVLKTLPDCSVDSIVTDPPYHLTTGKKGGTGEASASLKTPHGRARVTTGFMGMTWDGGDVAQDPAMWAECLRVLKPGGYLLAFSGTRTYHRMAVAIEDAGFEIRDMIAWVYGCLSEDSEVLTEDGWMPYNSAKQKSILAYDLQNDFYQWEKPSRWNEYRVESDTAYRIQSDHTDQIVSQGHRCIVERDGMLEFVPADELAGVERMPYLRDNFPALPQGRGELLLPAVLREGEGLAQESFSERQGQEVPSEGIAEGEKPSVEGRSDLLQAQGQVLGSVNQVRALPRKHDEHGAQGRVCDGAQACGGSGNWKATDAPGVRAPHQPRCDGQPTGEPDVVCDQCGAQTVRARPSYQTTVATVTAIEYSGLIWCPTVSTGAFVARRNGKVFITGNSGFPKSLDVSKAIDKAAGAEREVVGVPGKSGSVRNSMAGDFAGGEYMATAPATDAARQWQGWGTALKPALEPITVARKPLIGTVASNVLAHGTGALNIDGCRVEYEDDCRLLKGGSYGGNRTGAAGTSVFGTGDNEVSYQGGVPEGRWPANLIHDGSDEVVAAFPDAIGAQGDVRGTEPSRTGDESTVCYGKFAGRVAQAARKDGGSAARFFYCAKADRADRNEGLGAGGPPAVGTAATMRDREDADWKTRNGNHHPTVKPTDLMRYLCRLVTPPGGVVLDPFMGSGSTLKAAELEGFSGIGIELSPEYIAIARRRIAGDAPLFADVEVA